MNTNTNTHQCLQEQYAPHNACFGCGPKNAKGLHLRSFPDTTPTKKTNANAKTGKPGLIAHWTPEPHHEAFPGVLNGGIIGALLDCHSNWTAAWYLMQELQLSTPPCTVTADFHIRLKRPTPSQETLTLRSRIESLEESESTKAANTVRVFAELTAKDGKICATCVGHFVAVKPGHPAYHRW